MEPQRLIGQAVNTDDHRGRYVGRLEDSAPLRDQLTVTGEHDCLGRICRDVHRDLPTTVVVERLGDKFAPDRVGSRLGKGKIDQLEHGLEIFARTAAAHALFELADEGPR